MTDLHALAADLSALRTKLLERERRFGRASRWTKPLLWVGAAVLLFTLLLPILLPFTLPLLIGAAGVLAVRWALYVFVFKDPERTYRKAWTERMIPALIQAGGLELQHEGWSNFKTEDVNDLRMFFQRPHRLDTKGCVSGMDGRLRLAYASIIREKITLGTVLQDAAEDMVMSLLIDQADGGQVDSYTKHVPLFRGLLAEVHDLDLGRWMVIPGKLLPLYRRHSHYPAQLRLPAGEGEDPAILHDLEGHGPDAATLELIKAAQPAIVLSTGKSLWLALPRKRTFFVAHLDEPDSTEVEHLEQFTRDLAWIRKWSHVNGA